MPHPPLHYHAYGFVPCQFPIIQSSACFTHLAVHLPSLQGQHKITTPSNCHGQPSDKLFLSATHDNVLEEIPEEERDPDLTNHQLATLVKSLPCNTNKQKFNFALNKMTQKTRVTAVQKCQFNAWAPQV
uniref:Uncharacterized protein n=1 Tax=Romanomermis culicivorax TaxID=13658 RepID=A0A915K4H4_ROMCU